MRFRREASEPELRLGYCMNLHPAEDLAGLLDGMRTIAVPLARRFGGEEPFGVGMYLPASLAAELAANASALDELAGFLAAERLDAFTFNAFPAGGFGEEGLKARVFEPTWWEPARLAFTLDVARVAAALAERSESELPLLSISTHSGAHSSRPMGEEECAACASALAEVARELAALEASGAPRIVLGLEAEPRANANETASLAAWFEDLCERVDALEPSAAAPFARHVGVCLDACHVAVEFEPAEEALAHAHTCGPLAKFQFSSALALPKPGDDEAGRAALLALDEPAYLHQVTGRASDRLHRVGDLPELADVLERDPKPWLACDEWRCHFHVPVDLAAPLEGEGAGGLATTRADVDRLLALALEAPAAWGTAELHLELETYTWDVLPAAARGPGDLVDGLAREYEHVLARLADAGWTRAE